MGYFCKYDIEYEESFALVARLAFVYIVLAIVVVKQQRIFQMEIKNEFINGDAI